MKLIVGLGNPGQKYVRTRHNCGRELVESLALSLGAEFKKKGRFKSFVAEVSFQEEQVLFALPETYMNLSGEAVASLLRYYKIRHQEDMLVAVDDYALPLGQVRLRAQGSSGGHNGLKSIDGAIGTTDYARLRLGILGEADGRMPMEKFVLAKFASDEVETAGEMLTLGVEASKLWLTKPITEVMNVVNGSK